MGVTTTLLQVDANVDNFPALTAKETRKELEDICRYLRALNSGVRTGVQIIRRGHAIQGVANVTCASALAADTVTLNGVVFTAVNSGATGNQFNVGGTDAAAAASLAAAINGSVTAKVAGVMGASAASNVVTVFCLHPGITGTLATLVSSNGTRLAVSSNPFQNAANDTAVTYTLG